MSDLSQEILFSNAGLDTDVSQQYMSLGDAPYRLHILQGEDGLLGMITNMKGNHVATYHDLYLSNAYQVVGSHYNSLTRKVYYFVFSQPYDSTGSGDYLYDNKLLEFDEDTEVISLVFLDERNYFGIDLNHPVHDCDMLGDYLYFNPRISEPKMIDVVRAKNYTDYTAWAESTTYTSGDKVRFFGGIFVANTAVNADESPSTNPAKWERIGNSYQDETDLGEVWDSEFRYAFNVLRQIPVKRPTTAYGTDLDKHANNVRGKIFKFAYRFRYYDDTYSKFGFHSDNALPINEEKFNGEIADELDEFNFIYVNVGLHSPSLVKEVEIAFQEIGGDWKLAKVINRQDQELLDDPVYRYKFYNTDPWYTALPVSFFHVVDAVPRWAATQELINKNILAYGRPTEGFDNIDKNDIDVSLTPEIEDIGSLLDFTIIRDNLDYQPLGHPFGDWDIYYSRNRLPHYRIYVTMLRLWWSLGDPVPISAGDVFELQFSGYSKRKYTFTHADTVNVAHAIAEFIKAEFPKFEDVESSGNSVLIGGVKFVTKSLFYTPAAANVNIAKHRGFKTGAWHPFCIFYYDRAMRQGPAQTSKENIDGAGYTIDGTDVYIPTLGEYSPATTTDFRWIVNWEVNHLPPSWAKWWKWGYAGNSLCSDFRQYIIADIIDDAPHNWTRMNITPLQTLKNTTTYANQFPQSIIDPYQWNHGDRVRIITEKSSATELGAVVEGVHDYEIIKMETDDTTTPESYWIYTQDFDFDALNVGEDSLIEIYTPQKEDSEPNFYEIGEIMPIIEDSDGNLVHGVVSDAGIQNQDYDLGLPATGVFNAGDVYHILRTPSKAINNYEGWFHESKWYSDFYTSDIWDKGRMGAESSFGQRTLNIVRYSNQLMQNTRINGLSTFDALYDYKELNDIYGNIVSMMEVGTTLKVYMEKKSASILIGRQEYQDTAGNTTVATSNVVLGSVRYPENNFGTQFLESISKNNRYVYGYDVYNAVVWRDSANGLFPISGRFNDAIGGSGDYRMSTWFKEKSDALMLSGIENVQVLTVWDERYKNLYVIFKDNTNSDNDDVIVFHEPSNRWITFAEFWYTPVEGWNQMIELTYEVVKGFDLGIGFSFDEDTRFAVFDIETSGKTNLGMSCGALTLTGYNPTVRVDESPALSLGELTINGYNPTVTVYTTPNISFNNIEDIPDGNPTTVMTVEINYDNGGDADTIQVDWKINNIADEQINSGSQNITFAGSVTGAAVTMVGMSYPPAYEGYFFAIFVKKSTEDWDDAVIAEFGLL